MPTNAVTDQEIESCFDVMAELRPHLNKSDFLSVIRHMETEGFKLAYIKEGDEVMALAGYRIHTNLFMGKNLYVDDLVTTGDARSKGYGEQMVKWLRNEATRAGCSFYHLDSGTHRGNAHKFYFSQGFKIASFHFSEQIEL